MKRTLFATTAASKPSFLERVMPFLFDHDDDPDPNDDPNDDDESDPKDPPKNDDPKDPPKNDGPTAEEVAELRKKAEKAEADLEALRKDQDKFKGIDPKEARENAKKLKDLEEAARKAEKAKAEAEGNFERLREIQNEEHQAAVDEAERRAKEAEDRIAAMQARIDKQARSNAFANSSFLADETILNGAKAERIYGDYVEVEDGEVVVYDAPEGAKKRAVVMDNKGNPLPFDEAIKKVVEADPDKDHFLKAKLKPGPKTKTEDRTTKPTKSRHDRLVAGLKALKDK